jgi:hypothetical protein
MEAMMKERKNEMWLYDTERQVKTGKVAIKWRIFQGDSSSPLLFCLEFIPLTNMLNQQGEGYEVKEKIKLVIYSKWMT